MDQSEKIRILWIHDTEDEPGNVLPEEYDRYFTIVTKLQDGTARSIDSMVAFKEILERFWFNKDTAVLPVEIMAVDYDLSKRTSKALSRTTLPQDGYSKVKLAGQATNSRDQSSGESLDFDGLLLGLFYASLTYTHPVGFVPTTYRYTDLCRVTASVPELQSLSNHILGIHFDYVNTSPRRTWMNIIDAGVASLRERMKVLCERHWCIFDIGDLQALIQNPDHESLGFHSPHGMRRLPVKGLFIDKRDETEKRKYIHGWARSMIEQLSSYERLQEAEQFAKDLWEFYDNDSLVQKREELSRRLALDATAAIPQELQDAFAPITDTKKPRCSRGCYDIRSGSHLDSVRRLTVLEIILRLLKRCIQARKVVEQMTPSEFRENSAMLAPDRPVLNAEDVYLALFPVSESPLVFHWHTGKKINTSHGWASSLMDLGTGEGTQRRKGDLALKIQDVLDGKEWSPDSGSYGLMPSERHILRCKALSDKDLSLDDWNSHFVAKIIFRWEETGK